MICLLLGIVSPLSIVVGQQPRVPSSQDEIAAYLRIEDIPTVSLGIIGVSRIPHQEWTPALRSAILYALESEIQRDEEAARLGIQRFADENLVASLARLAIVMQDPATIPSLALMGGMGSARAALIAFGRQALPEMIRVVKEGNFNDATGCLIGIRQMAQEWGLGYFTLEEREKLKTLTAQFLSPDVPMIVADWHPAYRAIILKDAAHLALVLDDLQARGWVEHLAYSTESYQEKTGSPHADYHMKALQEALNGEPMLPETRPLSEYLESWKGGYGLVDRRQ